MNKEKKKGEEERREGRGGYGVITELDYVVLNFGGCLEEFEIVDIDNVLRNFVVGEGD